MLLKQSLALTFLFFIQYGYSLEEIPKSERDERHTLILNRQKRRTVFSPPSPPPPPLPPVPNFYDGSINNCALSLNDIDIQSAESPLILKPHRREYRKIDILYPKLENKECFINKNYQIENFITLACPGSFLHFPDEKNPSNLTATTLVAIPTGYGPVENFKLNLPGSSEFQSFSNPNNTSKIKCSKMPSSIMKKLSDDRYQIGFQLNPIDFIPVIEVVKKNNVTYARTQILPIIDRRPNQTEDFECIKGSLYKAMSSDPEKFYTKEFQSEHLEKLVKNKELAEKYTGDNLLTKGQLISKDDLFYIPQQKAAFYYENTVPIWKSINDGNWKKVGDIIRKIAHETSTNLDVYSGAIYLGDEEKVNSSEKVPSLLFKAAIDLRDSNRGVAIVTVNDPYVQVNSEGDISKDYVICSKQSECSELYPEFLVANKGYTYCCTIKELEDSVGFQTEKRQRNPPPYPIENYDK